LYGNYDDKRVFGPKRDEVTGECRRLHNKELYILYSSPNIITVIKSRRMRWAGHVARKGDRCIQDFWLGYLRERGHLGNLGVDGRIILKWIFKTWDREVWTGLIWLRIGTGGGRLRLW
jgi:hypothetical protein